MVIEFAEAAVFDDAAKIEVALGANEVLGRDVTRFGLLPRGNLFDVGQLPCFLQQRLLRSVEAKEDLELSLAACGYPIRLFAVVISWPEVEIDGTVAIDLKVRVLGGTTESLHVADEGVGGSVVYRRRPVLRDWGLRRHGEVIAAGLIQRLAVLSLESHQVELSGLQMLDADEGDGRGDAASINGIAVGFREAGGRAVDHLLDHFRRSR